MKNKILKAAEKKEAAKNFKIKKLYGVNFTPESLKQLSRLEESEPSSFEKANRLIEDLKQHPGIGGLGHPKALNKLEGCWSRRITKKHRLVYQIDDEKSIVVILRVYGHYDDK